MISYFIPSSLFDPIVQYRCGGRLTLCKERKGKERKGKERKGKERKGKVRSDQVWIFSKCLTVSTWPS